MGGPPRGGNGANSVLQPPRDADWHGGAAPGGLGVLAGAGPGRPGARPKLSFAKFHLAEVKPSFIGNYPQLISAFWQADVF